MGDRDIADELEDILAAIDTAASLEEVTKNLDQDELKALQALGGAVAERIEKFALELGEVMGREALRVDPGQARAGAVTERFTSLALFSAALKVAASSEMAQRQLNMALNLHAVTGYGAQPIASTPAAHARLDALLLAAGGN